MLNRRLRGGYAIGHFLNDCCASMWFTYFLIFFKKVITVSGDEASRLLLVGQVVDGCFTPIVGILSDRWTAISCYSQRKSWHLIGTILTAISFTFIFNTPLVGWNVLGPTEVNEVDFNQSANHTAHETLEPYGSTFFYYVPFIAVFQIGWATVQISHLALIPFLTTSDKQRADLNSLRYGVLIIANLFIYVLASSIFKKREQIGVSPCEMKQSVNPHNAPDFQTLALIGVGSGLFMSFAFHLLVREEAPERELELGAKEELHEQLEYLNDTQAVAEKPRRLDTPLDWMKYLPMYTNAIVYMAARLAANCLQIYLTLYISDTINLDPRYLGVLPFIQYAFGFIGAISTKYIHKMHSTAMAYICGGLLIYASGAIVYAISGTNYNQASWTELYPVYAIFALYGAGGNMVVCAALGLTAELIGDHTKSSAFVYGIMSFSEKIFNGIAVVLLEEINTCNNHKIHREAAVTAATTTALAPVTGAVADGAEECDDPKCLFYGLFVNFGTSGIITIGLIFVLIQRYVKH